MLENEASIDPNETPWITNAETIRENAECCLATLRAILAPTGEPPTAEGIMGLAWVIHSKGEGTLW